jgi:hypothetical protein
MKSRPLAVTLIAWLFIVVGVAALIGHASWHALRHPLATDYLWVVCTEVVAIISGFFMLRGKLWACWLALAWMAFHIALSWPQPAQIAIHSLFLLLLGYFLLRASSRNYFQARQ